MSKLTKFILMTLLGTLLMGTTAFAAEENKGFVVTPTSAAGYTNVETVVMADATGLGTIILNAEQCPDNIPLLITGITDTGYWEVDLGQAQKFYIIGPHLDDVTLTTTNTVGNSSKNDDNTVISNETVIIGEEACIQWIKNKYDGHYDYLNYDICREIYREVAREYEKCKKNPEVRVSYYTKYFPRRSIYEDNAWFVDFYFEEFEGTDYKEPDYYISFFSRDDGDFFCFDISKHRTFASMGIYFK